MTTTTTASMDLTRETRAALGAGIEKGVVSAPALDRTLLFVGPEGVAPKEQAKERGLALKCVDSYLQARYWLEKLPAQEMPFAIVCEVEWNRQADFALSEVIRENPVLRRVPYILISPNAQLLNFSTAMEMGVDDVYHTPFDWQDVFRRIEFLRGFKRELSLGNVAAASRFDGRIPVAKRIFDLTVAATVLLMLSPVILLIALLIKLESRGPIFYVSPRAGSGYDIFNFYKFRSMRQGADKELKELAQTNNQYAGNNGLQGIDQIDSQDQVFIKIENDPRITRVGRFIRNTSLDELPQLFNVLKGDMSIVGNRPLPLYEAEMLTSDGSAGRFLAPAGITGLWQVTKRGGQEMLITERIALDIEYAKNYSLWYDFRLILRTIPALLQQSNV